MEIIDENLLNTVSSYNKRRFECYKNHIPFNENKDYERILSARYMKVARIKKRFVYLISRFKYLYFCTFTFDNKYIECCDRTQRDLIKNSLNGFDKNIKYILNVDYGSKTERLHYHSIVATNSDDDLRSYLSINYPCRSNVKSIRLGSEDFNRVVKYINKLSNHCTKDSTKNRRIVYNFKGYSDLATNLYDEFVMYTIDKDLLGISYPCPC